MKNYLLLFIPIFLVSCGQATKNSANCGTGASFDPVTRTCINGAVASDTPEPTTNSIVIAQVK